MERGRWSFHRDCWYRSRARRRLGNGRASSFARGVDPLGRRSCGGIRRFEAVSTQSSNGDERGCGDDRNTFLLGVSLIAGEKWSLPSGLETWISFIYLVVFGTVVLFYLYLLVLSRWTASSTSYAFLLAPIVTVTLAAWLLGEEVTITFIIGGAIVLFGVWVGAFSSSSAKSEEIRAPSPEESALD